jgi:hypothetical protein
MQMKDLNMASMGLFPVLMVFLFLVGIRLLRELSGVRMTVIPEILYTENFIAISDLTGLGITSTLIQMPGTGLIRDLSIMPLPTRRISAIKIITIYRLLISKSGKMRQILFRKELTRLMSFLP